ncbi:MAG: alpha/beta hydrolase fold domain-containing protein [Verrucomicrobiales bacterium]|nr:alpha/beta hydrolase fold domain-containing protein [Verrucomicrobiales bacterium]
MIRFLLLFLCILAPNLLAEESHSRLFAHYMPWYSSKSFSGKWGYHWTMGHFDPDTIRWDGRREAASHDYPLIGLYDTRDPDALECQVLQMKLAGIEGVIIDWYGIRDFYDYGPLHESTQALIPMLKQAGMKFAICYEDQSIKHMVNGGNLKEGKALAHGKEVMRWMEKHWFSDEAYAKIDERPVLLVFGPQYFTPEEWIELRAEFTTNPSLHTLPHLAEKHNADGPFGWPPVSNGKSVNAATWTKSLKELYAREDSVIGLAFPGFQDIYAQAGTNSSYGFISDRDGATFRESLDVALASNTKLIQIATWNDYGEGTVVEPTHKLGYRYLERIQETVGPKNVTPEDLRLPAKLYRLRKQIGENPQLDEAATALFSSDTENAAKILTSLDESTKTMPAFFLDEPVDEDSKYRLLRNISYRDGERRCQLDLYYPSGGKPFSTVIWFHGGGISKGNKSIPLPLRNKGVAVVAANYRLSPGVKAPVYLEDAAAAVAWTVKNIGRYGGGQTKKVFVSGHSAGGYLASMVGLDPKWLGAHDLEPEALAGVIPFSGHTITHFTVRKEQGIDGKQPTIDPFAPLYHVNKSAPPMLLITGDRELELLARYEENAYFWRMMQEVGHPDTTLRELEGFDHGGMPEPAFPLLLDFIEKRSSN